MANERIAGSSSGVTRAAAALVLCVVTACSPSSRDEWTEALRLYEEHRNRSAVAFEAWSAIDGRTPEGSEARRRLAEADALYRDGIDRLARGEEGYDLVFAQAYATGPIDPHLNLSWARAYRAQADREPENPHPFIRAVEHYGRFLTLAPDAAEHGEALAELEALDPESAFDATAFSVPALAPAPEASSGLGVASALAGTAVVLALVAIGLLLARPRGPRAITLAELAKERPELHPAIAYLIGSLRHELLKHRIGAVASGVAELAGGRASLPASKFVTDRLYGGEPLVEAWEGHVAAFERALGPELDLRRTDVAFRRAGDAIRTLVALRADVERAEPSAIARLRAAHRELRAFDAALGKALHRLARTRVDEALLRDVVGAVRSELAAGSVVLDAIALEAPAPGPLVEVFRADLQLVLKNVVRNAILAVDRAPPPRRVRIFVSTELEATGEEMIVVRVFDTSPEMLDLEELRGRGVDRGLGLVMAALARYHGALDVEGGASGYTKAVVLRFFRAFDEDARDAEGGG